MQEQKEINKDYYSTCQMNSMAKRSCSSDDTAYIDLVMHQFDIDDLAVYRLVKVQKSVLCWTVLIIIRIMTIWYGDDGRCHQGTYMPSNCNTTVTSKFMRHHARQDEDSPISSLMLYGIAAATQTEANTHDLFSVSLKRLDL